MKPMAADRRNSRFPISPFIIRPTDSRRQPLRIRNCGARSRSPNERTMVIDRRFPTPVFAATAPYANRYIAGRILEPDGALGNEFRISTGFGKASDVAFDGTQPLIALWSGHLGLLTVSLVQRAGRVSAERASRSRRRHLMLSGLRLAGPDSLPPVWGALREAGC